MITVTIIGIIAAIAYPSYVQYVTRSYREAAKACLSEYGQFMERYYTTRLTYVGAAPALGCATDGGLDDRYSFSVSVPASATRSYTVAATPTGVQLANDTLCGSLTLNQLGVRTASGTGGVAQCW